MKIDISNCTNRTIYNQISHVLEKISRAILPGAYQGQPAEHMDYVLIKVTTLNIGLVILVVCCFTVPISGTWMVFAARTRKLRSLPDDIKWSFFLRFTRPLRYIISHFTFTIILMTNLACFTCFDFGSDRFLSFPSPLPSSNLWYTAKSTFFIFFWWFSDFLFVVGNPLENFPEWHLVKDHGIGNE